jgi:hypothetical protein
MAQPSGTFFIASRTRPDYVVSVPKGSTEPDAEIIEEVFTGGKKQQWIIADQRVRNAKSGLVWTATQKGLRQNYYHRTDAGQLFRFDDEKWHVQYSFWNGVRTAVLGHSTSFMWRGQPERIAVDLSANIYWFTPGLYEL